MKTGIHTWDTIEAIQGNLLVVINSPEDGAEQVEALLDAVAAHLPGAAVHVVTPASWRDRLLARGIAEDRLLVARDDKGREVEVNHFLESPAVVSWCIGAGFAAIVGTDAHNLYNEEIKDIFEQRVLLLVGDGVLLAHTLPIPYVYAFDAAQLVERCGREIKVARYRRDADALIGDLHQLWLASGKPARDDGADYAGVMAVVERHMGREVIDFDEVSPIPISAPAISPAIAGVVKHWREVMGEHDRQLAAMTALHAERSEAVVIREGLLKDMHAERVEAVNLRDAIIDDLRLQLEPWHRKLRRRWQAPRG